MNAFDRLLFLLALSLAVFGSAELYSQAHQAVRQAAACHNAQLQQVAVYGGL